MRQQSVITVAGAEVKVTAVAADLAETNKPTNNSEGRHPDHGMAALCRK